MTFPKLVLHEAGHNQFFSNEQECGFSGSIWLTSGEPDVLRQKFAYMVRLFAPRQLKPAPTNANQLEKKLLMDTRL